MSRRIKGLLAVALLLAVLLSMLSSCVQKPQAEVTTEWEGKEEIESSNGEMDKATAALAARYEEFELSVKTSNNKQKTKILNNQELYKWNSDFDLYYYGLDEVNIFIDNKTKYKRFF